MFFRNFLLLGLAPVALAKVQFLGIAIAGGDFGCQIDGSCPTGSVQFASDGAAQMNHFVQNDGMNLIRIPTSWQFLVNNQLGAALDSTNLGKYDQLMQACLKTGAHCMVDIHNFGHYNGQIIGQGGPTDDQFVSLWTQIATKYAANKNVVFELMNEPHDLDINVWAITCQKVVTAIRNAGATSQMILLPGTNFDSAATLVSTGSAAALLGITNPDGSKDNLYLDIHKYLDEDNSGTHEECVTNNIDAFTNIADFLRQNNRKGLVSESGASRSASCFTNFCAQNTFINSNSDVFIGFVGWAAGSFDTSYVLSLTPSKQGNSYIDNDLMKQCVLDPWNNSKESVTTSIATTTNAVVASTFSDTTMMLSTTSMPASVATTLLSAPGTPGGSGAVASGAGQNSNITATNGSTATSGSGSGSTSASSPISTGGAESAGRLMLSRLVFIGALLLLFV